MYKLLLCWRYLRTRYIALASIISVTLGVATMIVVNSVMSGFSHEMQSRMHGFLSDIMFESHGLDGFPDYNWHAARIREVIGDKIAGMSPTVHVPAMLTFQVGGRWVNRQVMMVGVERSYDTVSNCSEYLQHPENRKGLSFQLRDSPLDQHDHQNSSHDNPRKGVETDGVTHRHMLAEREREMIEQHRRTHPAPREDGPPGNPAGLPAAEPKDPFAEVAIPNRAAVDDRGVNPGPDAGRAVDMAPDQNPGIVLGYALASFRGHDGADYFLTVPGDDVKLTFPTAGTPPKAISANFTVVDFYESKMNEYDSQFVFVPLRALQEMRGMIDPQSGAANVTAIQIKLKPGVDLDAVRDKLRATFPPELYGVSTWRDKQAPMLAAVHMETVVLNILLFMIIAVAGFGILAIFFMIVVEKTRDIGVLKSLGASGSGIMSIFLTYGVSLGTVGSGVGLMIGLLFVRYIDRIRVVVEWITGQQVFDPTIYYFPEIPTIVEPWTIAWIIAGAVMIAVLASVLPAVRAARLRPVEALRYE